MEPKYPDIRRRHLSTLIDSVFIIYILIAASYIFQQENELSKMLRVETILAMFFIYESLCTSRLCTLGQKIMGIRVRKIDSFERISIPSAYLRVNVKVFLGIISFFTMLFTKNSKAIHDFTVGSIVICAEND